MKDEACSCEEKTELLHGALATNLMKSAISISKTPFRIVKKYSTTNATLLVLNTPDDSSEFDQNKEIVFPEKSSTNHHERPM